MGTTARPGRHAAPASGLLAAVPLPAVGLPVGGGRHGRPSHGPAGAALAVATAGGVVALALPGLGTPVAASAASHTAAAAPSAAPSATPLPAQVLSAATVEARQALADRASRTRRAPVAVVATPMRAKAVSAPVRPLLPGCTDDVPTSTDGFRNGRLPTRLLCDVGSGEQLRADAARAYAALAVAYESRFGTEPCLIDGYRSLGEQQVLRRTKRAFAAAPGTSQHGWGLAVDVGCGVQSRRTVQHAWMQDNAPRFGWVNPEWAQAGGTKPEPWHWEFRTGS